MGCTQGMDEDDSEDSRLLKGGEYGSLNNVRDLGDDGSIEDFYDVLTELGRGGSCRVIKARKKENGTDYAVKELAKDDPWNPILFKTEIQILTTLKHPNILEYVEAYVGEKNLYITTTLCTGGELFEKVKKLRHFSEKKAAEVLTTILTAVAHIHRNRLVHRDLKPENIVYDRPNGNIVLIDFGDAVEIESDGQIFSDFVGTPFYLAPECVRHRSGWELYKSDIWAVGVIAYVLLTGRPPFWGRNNREILTKITTKSVPWPKHVKLSRPCKHFILSLLQKDPRKRLSAQAALNHPWLIKESKYIDIHLGDEVLTNIANFANACKLKKLIVHRMVSELKQSDKAVIALAFKELDENGDGKIDRNELQGYLRGTGTLDEDEVIDRCEQLFAAMDLDKDGFIDLEEFIVGRTADSLASSGDLIQKHFEQLDLNGDGFITVEEIENAFGDIMDRQQLREIIKEVDIDHDGNISLEEFRHAMQGGDGLMASAINQKTSSKKKSSKKKGAAIRKVSDSDEFAD